MNKKSFNGLFALLLSIILCFTACLFGCGKKDEEPQYIKMGDEGTWGIYLYMCGSNLETNFGAAGKNLDEILAADIPDNVNFIIQTGGAKKWRSHDIDSSSLTRFKAESGELTALSSLPLSSMGDSKTLESFLTFCVQNYPAANMCVIVWDHGGGSLEGVANDENFNYDALSLEEMDDALSSVQKIMTDKFEMIGFDACLMSNYETLEMLSPYTRYVIGSEEIEPSGGWDYRSLIGGITQEGNGESLGKAICDGYFQKCTNDGKQSTATLSVTDIEKFQTVKSAFDGLTAKMFQSVEQAAGVRAVAQSANEAQKFGGNSKSEGYSNLIDMKHFADNAVDIDGSSALSEAIDGAVIYEVHGRAKSKSGGISFFYPTHFDSEQYEKYYSSICPSDSYKQYLNAVYGSIPENPIEFIDSGSIAADGSFYIKLSESSRNYILSVDFDLLEFIFLEDYTKPLPKFSLSHLGRDNDRLSNEKELTYNSNFRGIWLSLNGCKLYVTPIESTDEYIIFTAPIKLNGENTNLRFAFVWDDSYSGGGYYKILGAWDGIDPVTGMSDKELKIITPDDEISVIYPYREFTPVSDEHIEVGDEIMREELVPQGDYQVYEDPLSSYAYVYQFVVTDIFGNAHYSDAAFFFMDYTYDELKENPLPDGTYAASIKDIYRISGVSIL